LRSNKRRGQEIMRSKNYHFLFRGRFQVESLA
jgi:hypothetical protein